MRKFMIAAGAFSVTMLAAFCMFAVVIYDDKPTGQRIEESCRREFIAEGDVQDCQYRLTLEHVIELQNAGMERARSY